VTDSSSLLPPRTFVVGGHHVAIEGDHRVLDLVREELAPVATLAMPDLTIVGQKGPLPIIPNAGTLGGATVDGPLTRLRFDRAGLELEYRATPDRLPDRVRVGIGERPMPWRIPKRLFRWLEPTFQAPEENQAYLFIRHVLEGVLLLFGGETAALHASGVEHDGQAVLLTSAGGVGKTGISSILMRRGGWSYVSDDIVFIESSGVVHPYPRSVMMYGYNVRSDANLRRTVQRSGGFAGGVQWRLQGIMRPAGRRRRIAPSQVYGDVAGRRSSSISLCAFLTSTASHAPVNIVDITPAELARRSTLILEGEFAVLLGLVQLAEAAGGAQVRANAIARHRENLTKAFSKADKLVEVRIGASDGLERAAEAIESLARDLA